MGILTNHQNFNGHNMRDKGIFGGNLRIFIFVAYLIFAPFYIFASGIPQIADYLFLLLFVLLMFENKGRCVVDNWASRTVLGLALFVSYVVVLNLVWFAIDQNFKRLLFPAYYLFNLMVFYTCFQMYRKYGQLFLVSITYGVVISVFIQVLITFLAYRVSGKTTNFFNNPNQLGYFALLMGSIFTVITKQTKVPGVLQILIYICVCYLAILSLSRAAIIGSSLLVLIVSIRSIRSFLILVGIVLLAYILLRAIDNNMIDSLFTRIGIRMTSIGKGRYSTIAGRGYDRIWLNPQYLLFGAGEGDLSRFKSYLADHELHSSIGTVIFSYGLPGTALFGYFIFILVKSTKTWYLSLLIPTFIYGITHQGLRFTQLWILFAMVVIASHHEEDYMAGKGTDDARKGKVVIIVNAVWNIINFRKNLVRSLQTAGYDVVVFAPRDKHLSSLDTEFYHIPLYAQSMNPVRDLFLILRLSILLHRVKPNVVLNYTIKPTIYGTISARLLGIPCVNNITGLGTLFLKGVILRMLGFLLYSIVLRISDKTFFQNPDDFHFFDRYGFKRRRGVDILPGSGVDLNKFTTTDTEDEPSLDNVFLFVGRLLAEKGIQEYIDAARLVKQTCRQIRFQVLGLLNNEGKQFSIRYQLHKAIQEGVIDYLGTAEDVRPYIAKADCVVLPSYREGTPRSLLEAASMGKPLIATDVPGCREVVEDGKNGYLCRARDPEDLANKMVEFTHLSASERSKMGRFGRQKMQRQFDERIVIGKYLTVVKELVETRTAM